MIPSRSTSIKSSDTKKVTSVSASQKVDVSLSSASPLDNILFLQQKIGNQACGKLLSFSASQPGCSSDQQEDNLKHEEPSDPQKHTHSGIFRQSPNVSASGSASEIAAKGKTKGAETASSLSSRVFRKLMVGSVDDPLERQADAIAEQVVTMPPPNLQMKTRDASTQPPLAGGIGRIANSLETAAIAVPNNFISALGSGSPFPQPTKDYFEPRFGVDFSNVRIHASIQAAESAKSINARAYTLGNDIVFGAGEFQHHTEQGKKLIAHELTHVVQQSFVPSPVAPLTIDRSTTAENEAVRIAVSPELGETRLRPYAACGLAIQRTPAELGSASASLSLEEEIRQIPRLPDAEALEVLKRFQTFIRIRISSGEERIRQAMALRAESFGNYLIGGAIEVLGLTSLPSSSWDDAWRPLNAAYGTIARRQVKEGLEQLLAATRVTDEYWGRLNEYLDKTDKGADRSVFALQLLQAAGAVAAAALTGGGAAAIAVGAGYAGTQNLAGQATSVSIGIQKEIDWGGMAFDTLFGILTGALGGRLGNAVLKRLLTDPRTAPLGRRILAEVSTDLLSGRISSSFQTIARSLFDQLRGKEKLTVEEFWARLLDQLFDPKSIFIDALMGRAAKITHGPSSKKGAKSPSEEKPAVQTPKAGSPTAPPFTEPAQVLPQHSGAATETAAPAGQPNLNSTKPAPSEPLGEMFEPTQTPMAQHPEGFWQQAVELPEAQSGTPFEPTAYPPSGKVKASRIRGLLPGRAAVPGQQKIPEGMGMDSIRDPNLAVDLPSAEPSLPFEPTIREPVRSVSSKFAPKEGDLVEFPKKTLEAGWKGRIPETGGGVSVQAGHMIPKSTGAPDRLAIELTSRNLAAETKLVTKEAIEIEGAIIERESALELAKRGDFPKLSMDLVKNAPTVPGWAPPKEMPEAQARAGFMEKQRQVLASSAHPLHPLLEGYQEIAGHLPDRPTIIVTP